MADIIDLSAFRERRRRKERAATVERYEDAWDDEQFNRLIIAAAILSVSIAADEAGISF